VPIGKNRRQYPCHGRFFSAKKVFSRFWSTTATTLHPVNVPALKKIKKNLKKYLFFLKKVLTIGDKDAIL
jgi:hypothetical protein